jgi:2-methylisocitrate lyase-like PEP mutase family enzyme
LSEIGYACAIYPSLSALAANAAMFSALRHLRDTGVGGSAAVPLFPFDEFCKMIGFEAIWAFEEKWKGVLEK